MPTEREALTYSDRMGALDRFIAGEVEEGDLQIVKIACQELKEADIVDRIPEAAQTQQEMFEEFEDETASRVATAISRADPSVQSYFRKLLETEGLPTKTRAVLESEGANPGCKETPTPPPPRPPEDDEIPF